MLIVCNECGSEYSDQAKNCPHCGIATSQNDHISSIHAKKNFIKENNKGLAIAGYAIGIVTLFFLPILGILSVIFGAIAIGTNENNEPWNKAIWQYENKALGFGMSSLIIGIIDIIWMLFNYYMLINNLY